MSEIKLHKGAHTGRVAGEGCAMEYVYVRWLMEHGVSWNDAWKTLTDRPSCTARIVTSAVQSINDRLNDTDRQRLVDRLDRIQHAHEVRDSPKRKRVNVRVACWAARSVLRFIEDDECRAVAERAICAAEAWLRGEASESDCQTAAAAYAASAAAYAASAAAYAASAAAYAASAAAAAYAYVELDLLEWLDDLLDQYDKARAAEGVLNEEPPVPHSVSSA